MQTFGLAYGTALAARSGLIEAKGHTFAPNWPPFPKGFVRGTVRWAAAPTGAIDVVSVHLDFASSRARARQVEHLIEVLADRPEDRPLIALGDFNCSWDEPGGPLRALARGLDLTPVAPEHPEVSFPTRGTRLDWILIDHRLVAAEYRVLPDVISDHRAVLARLRLREAG